MVGLIKTIFLGFGAILLLIVMVWLNWMFIFHGLRKAWNMQTDDSIGERIATTVVLISIVGFLDSGLVFVAMGGGVKQ